MFVKLIPDLTWARAAEEQVHLEHGQPEVEGGLRLLLVRGVGQHDGDHHLGQGRRVEG